ncbi:MULTISPECIES: CoA-binding protein [unclassified Polaribacter]|uniref:CoA-binding protein n=1 Tax=unclassified Polaribacter TaxID=196858 RepID=UPI0011BF8A0C|nr:MULTISPECIES: CoA-binding protein [unclassified Polaribacter]TXD54449.1 CoA-binding protein [Polaribacter sp. IC063]TXD60362.1 CoA-binding protein [Polaribacter sp. IC066]
MKNRTLVIGASTNPNRYSNIAIKRLRDKELPVVALGFRKGKVLDVTVDDEQQEYKNIDTVTLYLNPERQEEYYNYIVSLAPRRVIFNPGTENTALVKLLEENKIEAEVACTLVLLSTDQY